MRKFLFPFLFLLIAVPAWATISSLNNSNTFGANGSTTVFTWNFPADSVNDLAVVLTSSTGAQTTLTPNQYLVALNPVSPGQLWSVGGTLTYPLVGSPLASGNTLTITRVLPLTQDTSLVSQGNYSPTIIEQALDTGLMQTQQVNARTGQIRGTWTTSTAYNYGDIVEDGVNGNDTTNLYLCAVPNTSGTWSTDLKNGDWSLALNVQGIVNSLPQIANNNVFGNISGVTNTPTGIGVSALLDSAIGSTQGDVLYRSGSLWSVLAPGSNGQFLTTGGAAANPSWTTGGTGTVSSVTCGTGLSGGTFTTTGTCSFASIASNALLANTTTGSAAPGATTLSAYIDSAIDNTQGDVLYRNGTVWTNLGPGTSGQYLQTGGAAANPSWNGVNKGSWTPVLNFGGTSIATQGGSYSTQSGIYDQTGKTVVASFDVALAATGTGSGAATITGLPVTTNSSTRNSCFLSYYSSMSGMSNSLSRADTSSTTVILGLAGSASPTAVSNSNFSNSSEIAGTCVYVAN